MYLLRRNALKPDRLSKQGNQPTRGILSSRVDSNASPVWERDLNFAAAMELFD